MASKDYLNIHFIPQRHKSKRNECVQRQQRGQQQQRELVARSNLLACVKLVGKQNTRLLR